MFCESDTYIQEKFSAITNYLIQRGYTISTMESCTGGEIASLLTNTEGSSATIKGAFVTYSNDSKVQQGVPQEIIDEFGVYSKETATAMARACKKAYDATVGVGVTGTFANVDPNNQDSVPGELYVTVIVQDFVKEFDIKLDPSPNRARYKMLIADIIADMLLDSLKGR